MKNLPNRRWALAAVIVGLSGSAAFGQDAIDGSHVIHTSFDRLVPISYPLFQTHFDRLRPTTYPVIDPGVAQVPITSNLTDSFAKPLLRPHFYGPANAPYGTTVVSAARISKPAVIARSGRTTTATAK